MNTTPHTSNSSQQPGDGQTSVPGISSDISKPAASLDRETYTLFHIALSRGAYEHIAPKSKEKFNAAAMGAQLRMVQVLEPTCDDFLHHLQRVGAKYGWDRRKKYQEANKPALEAMMQDSETKLYIFFVNNTPAGFCLVTAINDKPSLEQTERQGLSKNKVVNIFKSQKDLTLDTMAVEINKFGLYDEFTGKGYGDIFLEKVLNELFTQHKYGIVYLDTRDTNHKGVLKFYKDHHMKVFYEETLVTDLIPEGEVKKWDPATVDADRVLMVNGSRGMSPHPIVPAPPPPGAPPTPNTP
jgi:hypothetical protein